MDDLSRWLRDRGAPAWSDIAIVEISSKTRFDRTTTNQERIHVSKAEFRNLPSYENRFEHLLDQGYSWINLNGFGLVGSTLVVLVEIPHEPTSAKRTSVNLSGPPSTRGWDASDCVVLEE